MSLTRSAIPLYYQIAQILRSQIHAQEYKPGDLLPTETEMIRSLGVSRTTIRQALLLLLNERLIYRIAGKGTFVADECHSRRPDWSVENIDALIRVGCVTRVQFCGLKEIAASEALAKTFGIPPGAKLAQIQKLAFLDDEPFIHTTIHVPSELAAKIPLDRIGEKQVFALIEENCSVRIQEAHQWVSASLAGGTIARDLKLKPGDPILLLERHFEATDGRMIEESIDRYRTDRMRHYLRLTRTDSLGVVPIDRTLGNPRHPSRSPSEGDRRSEDE